MAHDNHVPSTLNLNFWFRFTPTTEVALCGHATLAAAFALYESDRVPKSNTISFHSLHSGILTCKRSNSGLLSLEFPSTPVNVIPKESASRETEIILEALELTDVNDILFICKSLHDGLVEITPEAFSRLRKVNYSKISALGATNLTGRGLIVTCRGGKHSGVLGDDLLSNKSYDFLSRCFFPLCGIDEDPVTGSAHCALIPYWQAKLHYSIGDELQGYQASRRGGVLILRLLPNDRVEISGHCHLTLKSKILV